MKTIVMELCLSVLFGTGLSRVIGNAARTAFSFCWLREVPEGALSLMVENSELAFRMKSIQSEISVQRLHLANLSHQVDFHFTTVFALFFPLCV